MTKHKRILDFLAQGLTPIQVLSLTGLQPSSLKALLQDEEFVQELEIERAKYTQVADEQAVIGNKYLSLEHKVLTQIESQISSAELKDAVRALEVISNVRVKNNATINQNTNNGTVNNIVQLMLPSHAIPEYLVNSANEVISIDNKPMLPMSSTKVSELFASLQKQGEHHV